MSQAPTEAMEFPPLPEPEWSSIAAWRDQMHAYLAADRAARAQTQGEPAGWILMPTTLTESWATYAQGAFMDHGWSATECFAARYAELIAVTRRASALAASPPMQPAIPKGAQGSATDGEA
jgi:hypothetical protein